MIGVIKTKEYAVTDVRWLWKGVQWVVPAYWGTYNFLFGVLQYES